MSYRFNNRGHRVPTTTIIAGPNVVVGTQGDKIQIGFGSKKRVNKPQSHFLTAAGFAPRYVKEIKLQSDSTPPTPPNISDKITISIFTPGDEVKITGITKGRGFAGGIKRWGFHGGPKTHGQSDRHRAPGSIGQTTTPGRVYKGKKMAGHYGVDKLTITGLEVIEVDPTNNILIVKGSVPGAKNGLLIVQKTGKVKGYTPPPEEKPKEDEEETKEEKKTESKNQSEDKKEKPDEKVEKKENKDAK